MDTFKDRAESIAKKVADIDRELTQHIRNVDENRRHNQARKHLFDTVIAQPNARHLRINNDDKYNHKCNIGNVAKLHPSSIRPAICFKKLRMNREKVVGEKREHSVVHFRKQCRHRAHYPSHWTNLWATVCLITTRSRIVRCVFVEEFF